MRACCAHVLCLDAPPVTFFISSIICSSGTSDAYIVNMVNNGYAQVTTRMPMHATSVTLHAASAEPYWRSAS